MEKPSDTADGKTRYIKKLIDSLEVEFFKEDKRGPLLEVDSLVYTEGDKAGINFEVMDTYLKVELCRFKHCTHFAFSTLETDDLQFYPVHIEAAFKMSVHIVYIVYQDGLQWRMMIARRNKPTLHYDPCLATRYKISKSAMELSKLLNPSYQIMSWPHQANPIDSGVLVILAIQKHVNLVKTTQRMINADVSRFRGSALRKLAEKFKLTVGGQPYTPPTFRTEQEQNKPKLNVQLLTERKARIDADIMYAFMNFLLEEFPKHSFRVIEKPEETTAAQLYEEITVEFRHSAVTIFYVVYHQMKRWRLIIIQKDTMFQHYDPADPSGSGVTSGYAKDLMRLMFKQNMDMWENPKWPKIKNRTDSGAYVLLAVEFHRDHPLKTWTITDELVDEFRNRMMTQLQWDYQLTAFGKPYTPPPLSDDLPLPPTIAKPMEKPAN